MEDVCGGTKPYLPPRRLEEEHRRSRDKALHAFHAKRKMGGDELASSYEAQLIKVSAW
jgi:atlastin